MFMAVRDKTVITSDPNRVLNICHLASSILSKWQQHLDAESALAIGMSEGPYDMLDEADRVGLSSHLAQSPRGMHTVLVVLETADVNERCVVRFDKNAPYVAGHEWIE